MGVTIRHTNQALSSQGNGLISRRVIWQCSQLLKHNRPEELFAVVMWSGPDRFDFYYRDNPGFIGNMHGWAENPTRFADGGEGGWVILNPHWEISRCQDWYTKFHDDVGSVIYTLEHILRTQWFLQQHGIKYVMSTYMSTVLPEWCRDHPDTAHLWNMLDHGSFLPVSGQYEWSRDCTDIDFRPGDYHPVPWHHEKFVDEVMWPFVKERL